MRREIAFFLLVTAGLILFSWVILSTLGTFEWNLQPIQDLMMQQLEKFKIPLTVIPLIR